MESDYKKRDELIRKSLVGSTVVITYLLCQATTWSYAAVCLLGLSYSIYNLDYKRRRFLRMLFRDLAVYIFYVSQYLDIAKWKKNNMTLPKMFQQACQKHPDKIMYYFEDEAWSYRQVDEYSNQVGHYLRSLGVEQGDDIALFMPNRLEYVPLWLGAQKIGAAVALINTNISGEQLAHCLRSTPIKAVVYDTELAQSLQEVYITVKDIHLCELGRKHEPIRISKAKDLRKELEEAPKSPPLFKSPQQSDNALYIFTSGTTGMPKAAKLSQARCIMLIRLVNAYARVRGDDVIYNMLPMYHANGGILAGGHPICFGSTVAIGKKFSVNNFWKDCVKYQCTVIIYIGEICRYLLAAPFRPEELQHNVRLMYGNGLRISIWKKFVNRFQIKNVAEFYGQTEGIGGTINREGVPGAVGFILIFHHLFIPTALVKIDPDTEMPARDADGRCVRVTQPHEPGMHISKIDDRIITSTYEGYMDKSATRKNIITNVFRPGDQYYVTGDTFTFDEEKFTYFHDRTGDTFRWRGENVSTTEVEQIISEILGLSDAAVYGVEIPGNEGKAGMAAIACEPNEQLLQELNQKMKKKLAKYAKPAFLRFMKKLEMTETFKFKKKQLKDEGYNPDLVDNLYYFNNKAEKYLPLTKNIFQDITERNFGF